MEQHQICSGSSMAQQHKMQQMEAASSIRIDISLPASEVKQLETGKKSGNKSFFIFQAWIPIIWEFCKENSNTVVFSLKAGLAVLLVSLLILFRAPYDVFGTNIIWAILTVAVMFEYTVGAMFNRGLNRALGSLLAGILAVAVGQVALYSGRAAQPIIIGVSIFLIGVATSFLKLWPPLVPYAYGFKIMLYTFCLIVVSGYRMGKPLITASDRLYSIAIGGFVAVLVNVLVFPVWAGDQLHEELVKSFDSVARSLEECVRKYLADDGCDHPELSKTVMYEFSDEPAYSRCQSILNSSAKLKSLAKSAKWEPPHGRFWSFFYPWSEYVKVGEVLRYCAYEVTALHGVLHSEIQAPYNLRMTFQPEIQDASSQAAELLWSLGKDISNMKRSFHSSLLKRVHSSTERLQRAIYMHCHLLTSSYDLLEYSSKPLPKISHAFLLTSDFSGELGSNTMKPSPNSRAQTGALPPPQAESYHERRRINSCSSIAVDELEEGGPSMDFLGRMKALESTAALSLATFTSLLMEFVARLDHLVEAVDVLAERAKFNHVDL